MISKIEVVKNAVGIEQVLERYNLVSVKGFYNCPFHSEKTNSFSVKNGRFRCFGCNKSGDLIDFVCEMEKISVADALKLFDGWYGLGFDRELTTKEKLKYRRQQQRREAERQRKENLEKYRSSVLEKIRTKLHFLEERKTYPIKVFEKIDLQLRIDRLVWWFFTIGEMPNQAKHDILDLVYGDLSNIELLRKLYKGEIKISKNLDLKGGI